MSETKAPIQSTLGAVPIRNEKGELSMQKVRVTRYITGKRPDYAPQGSSDEEDEDFIAKRREKQTGVEEPLRPRAAVHDRRLARLNQAQPADEPDEERYARHQRRVDEPEVIGGDSDEDIVARGHMSSESDDEEEEVDEEEIERRRQRLRERAQQLRTTEEQMERDDKQEAEEMSEEESSYEEYTDSEDDDDGPMLKPVFVRKKDRVTIQEKQKQVLKERELEIEAKKLAEERKQQARKLVEAIGKQEKETQLESLNAIDAVNTDDENDEEEYELWKIRELKRIKRDRDERDALEKEKADAEKLRNMTEEERKMELKLNPKKVTNQVNKGKYKFMQKYYHRGAFYTNEEDDILKRDFTAPTLEDHFDKTILPKVMQVKNFGRSGRTKYTHLADQDTTSTESPWSADTAHNIKFTNTAGGGLKQIFEKPSAKNKKK